jgi:hypothetical protein
MAPLGSELVYVKREVRPVEATNADVEDARM